MIFRVIYGCEITALDLNIIEGYCDNKYLLHNPHTGQDFFGLEAMSFDTKNPTQMIVDKNKVLDAKVAHILNYHWNKYLRETIDFVSKECEAFGRIHDYPRGYYIWKE